MEKMETDILDGLAQAVVAMDEELATELAREALRTGIDPYAAIMAGLGRGMQTVGMKYESGEYFVPHLLVAADALNAGVDILKPRLPAGAFGEFGKIVIGVVEGDIHDIGKNLVKIMLLASGFEVRDLGRDVPLKCFLEEAEKLQAQMICLSTLMTTSMDGLAEVIAMAQAQSVRHKFKIVVGGSPVSHSFAKKIGADGYGADAAQGVTVIKALLS